jgi:GNAT superfamily N-acetyltransferase
MSVARSRRWTTRTAVAQTLRILRRDGVAAAWFGALAETVYRRLLVVERDVTVAADAGIARGRYPLSAIEVRTVDVDAVAALYAAIGVERIPDISRRAGETWFAAFERERPVAVQALMSGGGSVPYLDVDITLADDAVLLGGLVVDRACRKRGVATRTIAAVLGYAAERGYRRAVALVLPENAGGRGLLQSLGFTPTGRVAARGIARARRAVFHSSTGRKPSAVLAVRMEAEADRP